MSLPINRRHFLGASAAGVALGLAGSASAASNRLVVGIMGTGGRGTGLATAFARQAGVTIGYVCDVDRTRVGRAADAVGRATSGAAPRAVRDFRRILDDRDGDVLVVATCNHWHAPAAILA